MPGMVRDLQVPNPMGYGICCLLPGGDMFPPGRTMTFTSHQWDCEHFGQQDRGTHHYVSTEDFQVWVWILILLSHQHLGVPPPSYYLLTTWKRRWTTTSIFSWVTPPQWSLPDRRDPTGQEEERKPTLYPYSSCELVGADDHTVGHRLWIPLQHSPYTA